MVFEEDHAGGTSYLVCIKSILLSNAREQTYIHIYGAQCNTLSSPEERLNKNCTQIKNSYIYKEKE